MGIFRGNLTTEAMIKRLLLIAFLSPTILCADTWHVRTTGTSGGTGSSASSWDLRTAFAHPDSVLAGDTILVHAGTYTGKFVADIEGTALAPIWVIATQDSVVIDGYVTTTLSGAMADTADITLTLTTAGPEFIEGTVVVVDSEHLYLYGKSGNNFNCERGWDGTAKTPHPDGSLVICGGTNLTITGSYTRYVNFEVKNSDTVRVFAEANTTEDWHKRGAGIFTSAGTGNKIINCLVHDGSNGVFSGSSATNLEVYGSLIYNNGYVAGGTYGGMGTYWQNDSGSTKALRNSIVFHNFRMGAQFRSETGNSIGLCADKVISFNNSKVKGTNVYDYNFYLAGSGTGDVTRDTVMYSYAYTDSNKAATSVRFGETTGNGAMVWIYSIVAGGGQAHEIQSWDTVVFHHNVLHTTANPVGNQDMILLDTAGTTLAGAIWDSNTYYRQVGTGGFYVTPGFTGTFPEFKTTLGDRFDQASTFTTGSMRDTAICISNLYDTTRSNLVIYNFDNGDSATVDVGDVYSDGDTVTIRNVQNLAERWTGVVSDTTLTVPMISSLWTVVKPYGLNTAYGTSFPRFGAFLAFKTGDAPDLPDPAITVSGSLSAFSTAKNDTSAEQTYSVSAIGLTDSILVTASTGFRVSKSSGSGYAQSLGLTPTGGTVASTTIYVTFWPTAWQSYSGNITHTSTGATQQNVSVSGSAVAPRVLLKRN